MESFIVQSKEEFGSFLLWLYQADCMHNTYADFQKSPDIQIWCDLLGIDLYSYDEEDSDDMVVEKAISTFDYADYSFPSIVTFDLSEDFDRMGDVSVRIFEVQPLRDYKKFLLDYAAFKARELEDVSKWEKYEEEKRVWRENLHT